MLSFRGTTYLSCTTEHDPDDKAWCSTKVCQDQPLQFQDIQWLIFHELIWNFKNNAQVDKNGDHVENAGVFIKIQSTWKSKYETNIQP